MVLLTSCESSALYVAYMQQQLMHVSLFACEHTVLRCVSSIDLKNGIHSAWHIMFFRMCECTFLCAFHGM